MRSRKERQREALLPPPELLERYESISGGLSKDLVKLVKEEQAHRQSLQRKYLWHYRLGQLFGFGYGVYVVYKVFELAEKGRENTAYTLAGIFGVLTFLILSQYKKDRRSAAIRSAKRHGDRGRRDYRRNDRNRNRSYGDNRRRDRRRRD